jgi:histidinol phosphatase-like enzyme (inositol monophosphatase family)
MHDGRCAAMIQIAMAAGNHTRTYFRHPDLEFDAKKDDSPVTIADREAEQLVRTLIKQQFAEDTVQGEEFAESSGTSDYRWVVDPIDGTKSFICGVPLYSTLLAIEFQGNPLGGVIYLPALDEIMVAVVGQGSWIRVGNSAWQAAKVSDRSDISEAVFVTSQVDSFDQRGAGQAYKRLEQAVRITRSWGDGYGYLMVASGRADIMVDPICNAWDVAAIAPIVTEAGGKFTDWKGVQTTRGGDGIGTNGRLHDDVLNLLAATSN